jgi:hypothetical protein
MTAHTPKLQVKLPARDLKLTLYNVWEHQRSEQRLIILILLREKNQTAIKYLK